MNLTPNPNPNPNPNPSPNPNQPRMIVLPLFDVHQSTNRGGFGKENCPFKIVVKISSNNGGRIQSWYDYTGGHAFRPVLCLKDHTQGATGMYPVRGPHLSQVVSGASATPLGVRETPSLSQEGGGHCQLTTPRHNL